jgi:hypothetical protein
MKNQATEMLQRGREHIDPIMTEHSFTWEQMWAGKSSGGISDSGRYVKGDRSLELHFRHSLGLVTYHIGDLSLKHEEYMRQCAPLGGAQYPGFSDNPLEGFKHLAHDLYAYATDFLSGTGEQLRMAKAAAEKRNSLSGLQKLRGT